MAKVCNRYVSMVEAVAILMLGEVSDEELLKLKGVAVEDLLEARRFLRKRLNWF